MTFERPATRTALLSRLLRTFAAPLATIAAPIALAACGSGALGADPSEGTLGLSGAGGYGPGCGGTTTQDDSSTSAPGTTSSATTTAAPSPEHLPCDVDAALAGCRTCHGAAPQFGAPMPLVGLADLVAPAKSDPTKKVYELVDARVNDAAHPMPPPPNEQLDAPSKAVLHAFAAGGGLGSTETCGAGAADAGPPGPKTMSCQPDQLMRPATPYAVKAEAQNEYVCFGFDAKIASKRHVIGLAPKVDNAAVVHHILLFQAPYPVSPTPQPCQAFTSAQWRLVSGWAPGGEPLELPPEAGFPEDGNTHWVLQIHYNNGQHLAGQLDSSGYDLCTTDVLRPNDADVMAPGSTKFMIPPQSKLDLQCDYQFGASHPVHVFSASPHMHLHGRGMSTENVTKSQMILDVENFDFNTQIAYPVTADIAPGDVLRTHCKWDNLTASPVSFGENTENEMCFDFLAYYPKVDGLFWSWAAPSAMAACHAN